MCFAFLHLIIEVEVFDCQNLQSVLSQRNIPTFSVLLVKKSLPLWSVHFYQCKAIKSACPSKMRWLADLISDWREFWHFPKKNHFKIWHEFHIFKSIFLVSYDEYWVFICSFDHDTKLLETFPNPDLSVSISLMLYKCI